VPNKWKFQGQEHVDDLDLNWDSFKWRNHQPDIGRFFNIDPLAEKYVYNSPYAFSENKVVAHIELEGLEALSIQFEVRAVVSAEVAGVTTSQTVGLAVGRSANAEGIHIAGFYTPTLGIAAGQGLTAGVNTSFYPTAAIEDLGGFGGAAGYFLTANPAGAGPVMSGEVNATDPRGNFKVGGTLGINPASFGLGGGVFAELSYTFLSDVVNVKDLGAGHPLVKELAEKFGVSKEAIIGGVNSMVSELFNQMNSNNQNQEEQSKKEQDQKSKQDEKDKKEENKR
jgi:RHS repeat-associated protein